MLSFICQRYKNNTVGTEIVNYARDKYLGTHSGQWIWKIIGTYFFDATKIILFHILMWQFPWFTALT